MALRLLVPLNVRLIPVKWKYAGKLFELFSRERVEKELNEFLVLDHFPRFGGGIGLTRFIRGMKASGLLTVGDHC